LRASPTTNLRLPRKDEGETVKALSEEELAGVLVQLPDEHKLFFRFLFETGLRIGEAIEVRYGDADLPESRRGLACRHSPIFTRQSLSP
jgi:integrase